jgi:hypothetical protein
LRIHAVEAENIVLKDELAREKFARQELEFKLDRWKSWATRLVKQLKDNSIQPCSFEE